MKSSRGPGLVLVAMTGSLSMVMLDQTVVAVALPVMSRELPLTATGQQWVVNAYVLAMAALVALGGRLGDRWGRVTTFRRGVVIFFLASLACGLTPYGPLGEPWLIGMRALQGAGAALMTPVSAAIVMAAFPSGTRGRAMAIYSGISQIFLAVGPLAGGVLTETTSWRLVFWLNIPVGLAALVLVHRARPLDDQTPAAPVPPVAIALLVGGLGASVLAVQQATRWGWTSFATLLTLGVGLTLLVAFVRMQLRARDPLVALQLFKERAFLGDAIVLGLTQFALLAIVLYGSLYTQDLLQFSPAIAGAAMLPLILPIALSAQIGGRWYDRRGVRAPVLSGLKLATVGVAAWGAALPALNFPLQLPGMVITGLGLGLVISTTSTDALGRVASPQRGQASGLIQTVRQLGGTVGVAAIGAVVLAVDSAGTLSPDITRAADAISAGFLVAALVTGAALATAALLLPHPQPPRPDRPPGRWTSPRPHETARDQR